MTHRLIASVAIFLCGSALDYTQSFINSSRLPYNDGQVFERQRIELREFIRELKQLRAAGDVSAMAVTAREFETAWRSKDASFYSDGLLEIVYVNLDGPIKRLTPLAAEYFALAVSRSGEWPIDKAVDFFSSPLCHNLSDQLPKNPATWPDDRQREAERLLGTWQSMAMELERADIPDLLAKTMTGAIPAPPPGTTLVSKIPRVINPVSIIASGMFPESIADPKVREEYAASLKDYVEATGTATYYRSLQSNEVYFKKVAERKLVASYSQPPYGHESVAIAGTAPNFREIIGLVRKHLKADADRNRIFTSLERALPLDVADVFRQQVLLDANDPGTGLRATAIAKRRNMSAIASASPQGAGGLNPTDTSVVPHEPQPVVATGGRGSARIFLVIITGCLGVLGWLFLRGRHAPRPPG